MNEYVKVSDFGRTESIPCEGLVKVAILVLTATGLIFAPIELLLS